MIMVNGSLVLSTTLVFKAPLLTHSFVTLWILEFVCCLISQKNPDQHFYLMLSCVKISLHEASVSQQDFLTSLRFPFCPEQNRSTSARITNLLACPQTHLFSNFTATPFILTNLLFWGPKTPTAALKLRPLLALNALYYEGFK